MEKGTVSIHFLETDTTIVINQLFSYIKKKAENGKDMMLISCKDMKHLETLSNNNGLLKISGRTLKNKKYPDGLQFTCSKCCLVRAQKRMGYSEYLLLCEENIDEK